MRFGCSTILIYFLFAFPGTLNARSAPRPSPKRSLHQWFTAARAAQDQGNLKRARQIFSWLTQREPKKGLYWFNLGTTLYQEGSYPKAIDSFSKVIRLRSPLAPVARLYQARSERKRNQPEAALSSLSPLLDLTLPPALSAEVNDEVRDILSIVLKSGIEAFQKREDQKAIRSFDLLLTFKGSDSEIRERTRLMKAMVLFRIERTEEAGNLLAQVSQSTRNSSVRDTSRALLRALIRADYFGQFPWWSFLNLSSGYNSNVFGDHVTVGPAKSIYSEILAGAGFRFFKRGQYTSSLSSQLGITQFYEQSQARNIQWNWSAPFTIENLNRWINLSPFFNFEMTGATPYLYKPGFSLGYGWKAPNQEWSLMLTSMGKLPASKETFYAHGMIHEIRGARSWIKPDDVLISSLIFGHETSGSLPLAGGDLPLANTYVTPGVSWKHLSHRGQGFPWEFTGSFAYTGRFFFPWRRDGQLFVDATAGKWLSRGLKIYCGLTFIENHSTFDSNAFINKNFNNWIGAAGFAWDIHQ